MDPPSTSPSLYGQSLEKYASASRQLRKELSESQVPQKGLSDTEKQLERISHAIIRATAPTYFAFVTGGVTPIAALADNYVTKIDANAAAHLPDVSVATNVEDCALRWLLEMFKLDPEQWKHRIFTTGATGSNVLGLACGRDYVVREAARTKLHQNLSIGESGIFETLNQLQVKGIRILSTMPHSSLVKAASIVGIGRGNVVDVTRAGTVLSMDLEKLEAELSSNKYLNIVAVSCGEVNTGIFATNGQDMQKISDLCKRHGAWLHVDGGMCLANGANCKLIRDSFWSQRKVA
jgi:glutamate/tyrosine decarboxylase-like PLP-dependent enzyme